MVLPRPISPAQTDSQSPLNMALFDSVRENLEHLDMEQDLGGSQVFDKVWSNHGSLNRIKEIAENSTRPNRPMDTQVSLISGTIQDLTVRTGFQGSEGSGTLAFDLHRKRSVDEGINQIRPAKTIVTTNAVTYRDSTAAASRRYTSRTVSNKEAVAGIDIISIKRIPIEIEGLKIKNDLFYIKLDINKSDFDLELWRKVRTINIEGSIPANNNTGIIIHTVSPVGVPALIVESSTLVDHDVKIGSVSPETVQKLDLSTSPGTGYQVDDWIHVPHGSVLIAGQILKLDANSIWVQFQSTIITQTQLNALSIPTINSTFITIAVPNANTNKHFRVGSRISVLGNTFNTIVEISSTGVTINLPQGLANLNPSQLDSFIVRYDTGLASNLQGVEVGDGFTALESDGAITREVDGVSLYLELTQPITGAVTKAQTLTSTAMRLSLSRDLAGEIEIGDRVNLFDDEAFLVKAINSDNNFNVDVDIFERLNFLDAVWGDTSRTTRNLFDQDLKIKAVYKKLSDIIQIVNMNFTNSIGRLYDLKDRIVNTEAIRQESLSLFFYSIPSNMIGLEVNLRIIERGDPGAVDAMTGVLPIPAMANAHNTLSLNERIMSEWIDVLKLPRRGVGPAAIDGISQLADVNGNFARRRNLEATLRFMVETLRVPQSGDEGKSVIVNNSLEYEIGDVTVPPTQVTFKEKVIWTHHLLVDGQGDPLGPPFRLVDPSLPLSNTSFTVNRTPQTYLLNNQGTGITSNDYDFYDLIFGVMNTENPANRQNFGVIQPSPTIQRYLPIGVNQAVIRATKEMLNQVFGANSAITFEGGFQDEGWLYRLKATLISSEISGTRQMAITTVSPARLNFGGSTFIENTSGLVLMQIVGIKY